jgi:hypothetical protein
MISTRWAPFALATLVLVGACASSGRPATSRYSESQDEADARQSAVSILDGGRLANAVESGATLPQILTSRVPSLRLVSNGGISGECPLFVLRGPASLTALTVPDIYLDNMRAQDSCVLQTVLPQQLRSIEVYSGGAAPSGIATRANTGGAIVLRTRGGR